jgi:hypothetical protein
MMNAWPSILARKSLHAREKLLIPALESYFNNNLHLQGSILIQCHHKHNIHHGVKGRDIAATEVGHMFALLSNALPGAFWLVYHIFSNSVVLRDLRAELEQLGTDKDGVCTVNLTHIMSSCPVLFSTWQETLRYMHIGVSARVVMEDTLLDHKYLLKKGSTVMMAPLIQHGDPELWGPTANSFDHQRFLVQPGKKLLKSPAFRPFGGGTMLCPGRHLITSFVMSLAAMLVLRFDLKVPGKEWPEPQLDCSMSSSLPTPRDDIQVEFVPRKNQNWRVHFVSS